MQTDRVNLVNQGIVERAVLQSMGVFLPYDAPAQNNLGAGP